MTKILLAEDDPNLGTLLQEYLTIKGYETTLAKDGDDALTKFVQQSYDLCIFDVMMPQKGWFYTCQRGADDRPKHAYYLPDRQSHERRHPPRF